MKIELKHDYTEEKQKLEETLDFQKKYYKKITDSVAKVDEDVEYGIKHFNSDNAEQFNALLINSSIQAMMKKKIQNLIKSMSKPYFARVDFKENGRKELDKIYIGKISLIEENTQKMIVTDWRSPVANLYYEGRVGKANYVCPDGEVLGEISLKRQYSIENACLQNYFDIDITTNDDFLQACLGSNADNRLKDIVSTIQAEQNKVIRAEMWNPLVVQGAAGGGKTTIALHRIAYLIYTYENSFKPDNFMIIAPNRFFLNYISDVLPELGVENVTQTTYEDFARSVLGKKLRIREGYEKLGVIVNSENKILSDELKKVSELKSSLEFRDMLMEYIEKIEDELLPEDDFKIMKFKLISRNNITKLFKEEYGHLPYKKRIPEIKKHLVNVLKRNKGKIIRKIEDLYEEKLDEIRYNQVDSPERRKIIIKYISQRDALCEKLEKQSKSVVNEYLSKISIKNVEQYYLDFINDLNCNSKEGLHEVCEITSEAINTNLYEIEDLAPLLMLKMKIFGLNDKFNIKHVVVDEAQDFSLFQFYMLRSIIGSSSMTILGDLCQGINSYRGINDWNDVIEKVFSERKCTFLKLDQSYRTTIEIMDVANEVISQLNDEKLPPAKPVLRHGDKVKVEKVISHNQMIKYIKGDIELMKEKQYKSMAIICKTLSECINIQKELKKEGIKIQLIKGSEKKYNGGIAVIPSYLVKGLEFDVVCIANCNSSNYSSDSLDVKLLYVALTRPLHNLNIYSVGEVSQLIS